ncbi:hypothetical protein C8N44_10911 [Allosediminivita pacifica]|uniref:Muramidase (Phage lambda lysozyme) n=3 Tax=Allosediminivita pacifica TaxID=1267769 RepID=A0A2T6AX07_9RHOB|nr:hypothetical protein C8N44_10911 [Allosediminivita pacifica]
MVRAMILIPSVRMTLPRCLLVPLLLSGPVAAQGIPLIQGANGPLLRQAQPLVQPREGEGGSTGASLFAGREGTSLFARIPRSPLPGPNASRGERLRHLIAAAEAGPDGYDAVQHGARIRPPKPPTQMTLAEIEAWTRATPGQPHAIGRYQFIPDTLRMLIKRGGFESDTRFSPQVQDRLADMLIADAGLAEALQGDLTATQFMNNLAKIWAGLPTSSGWSHYHGHAGNRATRTWAWFERQMAPILASDTDRN